MTLPRLTRYEAGPAGEGELTMEDTTILVRFGRIQPGRADVVRRCSPIRVSEQGVPPICGGDQVQRRQRANAKIFTAQPVRSGDRGAPVCRKSSRAEGLSQRLPDGGVSLFPRRRECRIRWEKRMAMAPLPDALFWIRPTVRIDQDPGETLAICVPSCSRKRGRCSWAW